MWRIPNIPNIPGLETVPFLTNQSLLDLTELPRHLVVLGGGYIGIEYAQAFRRFGSEVTVIQSGKQISQEDQDVAKCAQEILENEKVKILLGHKAIRAALRGRDVVVTAESDGKQKEVVGSHLLVGLTDACPTPIRSMWKTRASSWMISSMLWSMITLKPVSITSLPSANATGTARLLTPPTTTMR